MKKLLSISFCLLLCLTSMCVLSACKIQEKPLSEESSLTAITTAINNLSSKTTLEVKMNMGILGTMVVAQNDEGSYVDMMGTQMWTKTEDGVVYQYTVFTMEILGEEITSYTKGEYVEEDEEYFDVEDIELQEGATFVSGSLAGSKKTIVYQLVEDDQVSTGTYVIENDLLVSFSVESDGVTQVAITFKYDADVNIPELPTVDAEGNEIVWEE